MPKVNNYLIVTALIKRLFYIWFFSLLGFFLLLLFGTNFFQSAVNQTRIGKTPLFIWLIIAIILIGFLTFLFGEIVLLIAVFRYEVRKEEKSKLKLVIELLLILIFFPVFIVFKSVQERLIFRKSVSGPRKPIFFSEIRFILLQVLSIPVWVVGYILVGFIVANFVGYATLPISIAGTGSMYPTFPKSNEKGLKKQAREIVGTYGFFPYPNGLLVVGYRFFSYELQRGDIVTADNKIIDEYSKKLYGSPGSVVKRIIALSGDSIELRDGVVYLNSKPLLEPYTYKPHSTFGENFLSECKQVTIPKNQAFIMGDNRTGSGDSREFGFISYQDIKFVLPLDKQKGVLDKYYRNTSNDLSESSKIKLDEVRYIQLLNKEREKTGAKPLKYQPLLEKSAYKRGDVILKYDDFSFEATRSGYTMQRALNDVGYSNIVYAEEPVLGYYDSNDLLENQLQFPASKKFLLDKQYQEIGIAAVEGTLNGCPTQIIVQHLAGYVPPNYKPSDIEGWQEILNRLKEIQPSWLNLKNNSEFYNSRRKEVDRINDIISTRISNIEGIVATMNSNKWLSKQQIDYMYQDTTLSNEEEALAKKLNSNE